MKFILGKILEIAAVLSLICILLGLPVMLLWNWTLPHIFNVPYISFFQAVGVNLLCSLLFKTNVNINKE